MDFLNELMLRLAEDTVLSVVAAMLLLLIGAVLGPFFNSVGLLVRGRFDKAQEVAGKIFEVFLGVVFGVPVVILVYWWFLIKPLIWVWERLPDGFRSWFDIPFLESAWRF